MLLVHTIFKRLRQLLMIRVKSKGNVDPLSRPPSPPLSLPSPPLLPPSPLPHLPPFPLPFPLRREHKEHKIAAARVFNSFYDNEGGKNTRYGKHYFRRLHRFLIVLRFSALTRGWLRAGLWAAAQVGVRAKGRAQKRRNLESYEGNFFRFNIACCWELHSNSTL